MLLDNEDKISVSVSHTHQWFNEVMIKIYCPLNAFLSANRQTGWSKNLQTGLSFCMWWVEIRLTLIMSRLKILFRTEYSVFDSSLSSPQYLHKLFKRDHHKGQKYHERQIGLYAEYDRPNLLPFLRDSTHCPLEKVRLSYVILLHSQIPTNYTWMMPSPLFCPFLSGSWNLSAEELRRGDRVPAQ